MGSSTSSLNISAQHELSIDALTVPCLPFFSKTMMFALAGILTRTGRPLSRPCEQKAAKSLSSAWLLYSAWGSVCVPGWRRCQGQGNAVSTRRLKRGPVVRTLDFGVKCLNGSSRIWQGWNFSSELRKGRRWRQREVKVRLRTRACQGWYGSGSIWSTAARAQVTLTVCLIL